MGLKKRGGRGGGRRFLKQRLRYWRFPILGKKGKGELRPSPKKDPSPLASFSAQRGRRRRDKKEKKDGEKGEREMSKMVFSDERRGEDRGRSLSLFLLPLGLRPPCTYGRRRRIYAGGGGVALRPGCMGFDQSCGVNIL